MTQPDTPLMKRFGIGTSSWHWFGRAFLVGLMMVGAANSISYFVLSEGYSNLVGWKTDEQEKIGFPFEVWQRGKTYGQNLINFPAFYKNGAVGAGLGLALGLLAVVIRNSLNSIAEQVLRADLATEGPPETVEPKSRPSKGNQFSLGAMMVGTTIVAVIVGIATKLRPDPRVMAAIFFLAPIVMIGITMLPRRWTLNFRVAVLTVLAVSSIGVAIAVGSGLGMPFDEVLMGIFICWTPQGAIGTLLLLLWLAWYGGSHRIKKLDSPTRAE